MRRNNYSGLLNRRDVDRLLDPSQLELSGQDVKTYRVFTTSSILRMLRTVSVARVRALMETSRG